MKKRLLWFFLAVTPLGMLVSCNSTEYSPSIRFPCEWPGSPGFHGNIDRQNFDQPSGLCFHPLRKTLFVVSDEGVVAELKTDGTPIFSQIVPGDLEGITVDPTSGLLYLVIEGEDVILEFDPEKKLVTRRFSINREYQGNPNFLQKQVDVYDNGIESICFVPDRNHPEGGVFYAGNQEDPPCVLELLVPLKSSQAESAEARIVRVLPLKMNDPAGMYYDPETKRLNIVSDSDNILVEITLDGQIVREYAFPGDTQEGIAVDEESHIYIAQDSGGIFKLKDLRTK